MPNPVIEIRVYVEADTDDEELARGLCHAAAHLGREAGGHLPDGGLWQVTRFPRPRRSGVPMVEEAIVDADTRTSIRELRARLSGDVADDFELMSVDTQRTIVAGLLERLEDGERSVFDRLFGSQVADSRLTAARELILRTLRGRGAL